MKVFSKSDNKVIVQLRSFKRAKDGSMKWDDSPPSHYTTPEIEKVYQHVTELFEREEDHDALRAQA